MTIRLMAFAAPGLQNSRTRLLGQHSEEAVMLLRIKGQGLAEYALILALIAILAITALLFLSQINTILSTIGNKL
jgi:hypothetical protein